MNLKFWRALGVALPFINAAALFGITKSFDAGIEQNLFSTGITLGVILAVFNLLLGYAIYKNLT